jgi:hypothetical protein
MRLDESGARDVLLPDEHDRADAYVALYQELLSGLTGGQAAREYDRLFARRLAAAVWAYGRQTGNAAHLTQVIASCLERFDERRSLLKEYSDDVDIGGAHLAMARQVLEFHRMVASMARTFGPKNVVPLREVG